MTVFYLEKHFKNSCNNSIAGWADRLKNQFWTIDRSTEFKSICMEMEQNASSYMFTNGVEMIMLVRWAVERDGGRVLSITASLTAYLCQAMLIAGHIRRVARSYLFICLCSFTLCCLKLLPLPVLYFCFIHASHLLTATILYGLPVASALTCHLSSSPKNHLCLFLHSFYPCGLCLFFMDVLPWLWAEYKAVDRSRLVK